MSLAGRILEEYAALTVIEKTRFFQELVTDFGPNEVALEAAIHDFQADPGPLAAARVHDAAEPRRQELIRRLNQGVAATKKLVDLRADLGLLLREVPALKPLDDDFVHLFSSWFNRGFLSLSRIDWNSPADVLEKIIRYEAVHAIPTWADLRLRLLPKDRRCFAFFHPAMPGEPLIFVEVALTAAIPSAIEPLLAQDREELAPDKVTTAVFYSISNCQAGLRGISFGNFLIKQVVEELLREMPHLKTFVTLSPVPGLGRWLDAIRASRSPPLAGISIDRIGTLLADVAGERVSATAKTDLTKLAYRYLTLEKDAHGKPLDPVARFHLGNGAKLQRLNWLGDRSPGGIAQGCGFMVNYLYDRSQIETNHERFANDGEMAMSGVIRSASRNSGF